MFGLATIISPVFIPAITSHNNKKTVISTHKYPESVIDIKTERGLHPTQKPVALLEYLIKTYTNENDTVLDFTMGSGTTGVACLNTNRNFIGFELDPIYFGIAQKRIMGSSTKPQQMPTTPKNPQLTLSF